MRSSSATGQWFVAADGQRWWFDSGSLAVDFAYTWGFAGPREWERWHGPEDLATWWTERFDVVVPVDADDYAAARELRGAIAATVTATAAGEAITDHSAAVIDRCAARADVAPQLRAEPAVSSARLLATIARDAVATLAIPDRVRVCGAEDCALIYLDTSRSGNRAWCSMRRCGNRHKVRALRARRAAANSDLIDERARQPRKEHDS